MKTSDDGINLIKKFEGFRSKPYQDVAGISTIGFGNTHYLDGRKVQLNDPAITLEEGEALLLAVLPKYERAVLNCLKVPVTQAQFDALVSFCYNLGEKNLARSTLMRKLNAGDTIGASEEFERWVRAGNKVLKGLVKRRKAEKQLFLK